MPTYSCYGLAIESKLPLPEIVPSDSTTPDIAIHFGEIKTPAAAVPIAYRANSPDDVYVLYRGVGDARVIRGQEITIEPAPGVDPLVFRLFVLQQVLGVALLQRGLLVLHASSVVINGRAVAFAGVSGQGKSTMSAALHGLGGQILADDVLAIDLSNPERPVALPGLMQLKLTEQTRAAVAPHITAEQNLDSKRGKALCEIRSAPIREGVPLDALYLLGTAPEIRFENIAPAKAAIELVANTYGSKLLPYIGRAQSHFQQCVALARKIPIIYLTRPRDLSRLSEIAQAVASRVA